MKPRIFNWEKYDFQKEARTNLIAYRSKGFYYLSYLWNGILVSGDVHRCKTSAEMNKYLKDHRV